MSDTKLDINKTKYRYLMDNIDLKGTAITYTIPVDKDPAEIDGELNRNYPSVKISYKKFVKMIDKTASALIGLGVKKGDIIIVCSSNVPETIYMDYAMSKIGAIPSYIYPNITPEEMKFYFNEVNAKYVYILDTPEIRKNVIKALDGTSIEKIIASSILESFPFWFKAIAKMKEQKKDEILCDKIITWSDFFKLCNSESFENEYKPNDLCSLIHTSGTSSIPKAVMESNENINAIINNYTLEGMIINNKALNTIPLFVEFGKVLSHMVFCMGGNQIIIPEVNYKHLTDLVIKYKPEIFETTPSHMKEMLKSKKIEDLSFIKMACFGGDGFDVIEQEVREFFKKHNSKATIINGYGATEVSAAAISNTQNKNRFGSIGVPLGMTEAVILEPNTYDIISVENTVGEIAITGPTVTLGYYNDKNETNNIYQKHNDGKVWVHMGDLAHFDEDGFFYYDGRIKNVIVKGSYKFSSKEIENAILLNKNVSQCVVVGKYDNNFGQVPSAHIVLKDDSDIKKAFDEIIESVNANVQEFHRPAVYKIKNSIIITRNNKVNINALKIEDIATIVENVNDAEISLSNDNEYDYKLKLFCDKEIDEQNAISFIEETAKNEKVLNGKIKYSFIVGNGKSFIKHI